MAFVASSSPKKGWLVPHLPQVLLVLLRCSYAVEGELVSVAYVSRHGVRTPYPPDQGTVNDWSAYTPRSPPSAADWHMDQEAFEEQHLTPHGIELMKLMGSYYRQHWDNASLFGADQEPCDLSAGGVTIAFADDSFRDVQTAEAFLEGFGCPAGGETRFLLIQFFRGRSVGPENGARPMPPPPPPPNKQTAALPKE